ncbi:MAG: hypothetical protein Q7S53_02515 [bacterium]|nr:hypothetical protein [bacterium]
MIETKFSINIGELIKGRIAIAVAEAFIVSTVESERFVQDFFDDPNPFIKDLMAYAGKKSVSGDEDKIERRIEQAIEKNIKHYKTRPFDQYRDQMVYEAYQALLKDEFSSMVTGVLLDAFPAFWEFVEEAARKRKHMGFMIDGRFN